jgi:tRNA-2-methylthio-N6-dimethylallyladenosine synthase
VSRREAFASNGVELGWEKRKSELSVRTQMVGRTRGDQVVVFDGDASMKGRIMELGIIDAQSLTLFGSEPERSGVVGKDENIPVTAEIP